MARVTSQQGLTLDSGVLIAIERGDRRPISYLKRALQRGSRVTVPTAALAQSWRKNSPRIAQLIKACTLDGLDERAAKRIGNLLADSGTSDIVDAFVTIGAVERRDAVLTSDPDDIRHLAEKLPASLTVLPL